jgi:hypothetical protein
VRLFVLSAMVACGLLRALLRFAQNIQRGAMGRSCRSLYLCRENRPRSRQFAKPGSAVILIDRPFEETAASQPFEHAGRRRAIELACSRLRQRTLSRPLKSLRKC